MLSDVIIHPATADRWEDLAEIFEGKGDPGKCGCVYWYLSAKAFKEEWGHNQVVSESQTRRSTRQPIFRFWP